MEPWIPKTNDLDLEGDLTTWNFEVELLLAQAYCVSMKCCFIIPNHLLNLHVNCVLVDFRYLINSSDYNLEGHKLINLPAWQIGQMTNQRFNLIMLNMSKMPLFASFKNLFGMDDLKIWLILIIELLLFKKLENISYIDNMQPIEYISIWAASRHSVTVCLYPWKKTLPMKYYLPLAKVLLGNQY